MLFSRRTVVFLLLVFIIIDNLVVIVSLSSTPFAVLSSQTDPIHTRCIIMLAPN